MVVVLQVVWLNQKSIPLSYDERRIIDDSRFSVVRPLVRDWNLQLQDVQLEDQGVYRCTVNAKPVASKLISLKVTGIRSFRTAYTMLLIAVSYSYSYSYSYFILKHATDVHEENANDNYGGKKITTYT